MKCPPPFLYAFYFICTLFLLSGCNGNLIKPGINENVEVSFKSSNGGYVSADRNQHNLLIADRNKVAEWEKFKFHFAKDGYVRVEASDYTYVGVASDLKLCSGFTTNDEVTNFKVIVHGLSGVIIQDHNNRYIRVGENNRLCADQVKKDNATVFYIEEVPVQNTWFSGDQLSLLISGLVLLFISLVTFQYFENKRISILLLISGGFLVRLFVALLNPGLEIWDEQIHALVAKNMMMHPFKPMLYKNAVLPFELHDWVGNHIWLHKQPLFLWQMALSMKVFGVNVIALRLPSVLMSALVLYFIYRIGSLVVSRTAGFYGAVLFALSNFVLEITAGAINTDHNDVAFMFYIAASVWSWIEYESATSSRMKYIFLALTGLFSGCAIMVKWLTGLLVYSGWGLSVLLISERRRIWTFYRDILYSLLITLIVALPWQLYIINMFPAESAYEYSYNTKHFSEVLEGHGGDFWFHFNKAKDIYGVSMFYILVSIAVFIWKVRNRIFRIAFSVMLISVYVFYGLAATKMIAFTFCLSFMIYLALGTAIAYLLELIVVNPKYNTRKLYNVIYITLVLGLISVCNLNLDAIQEKHTMWKKDENSFLSQRLKSTEFAKRLPEVLDHPEKIVLLNCGQNEDIPVMFFTDVIAAYGHMPDYSVCQILMRKGYQLAVIDNGQLPESIAGNRDIIKIQR